jgi:ferredoxin-NADP reductase
MPPVATSRPVHAVDVAARCAAAVLPHAFAPRIDQIRLDARAVLDEIQGRHAPAYRDAQHPIHRPPRLDEIDPLQAVLPDRLARRYRAFRRDLSMVWQGLAGHHPPPFLRRSGRAHGVRRNAAPSVAPRIMHVTRIAHATPAAITLHLANPSGAAIDFAAGQFVTVLLNLGGQTHRRAYSICSAPGAGDDFAITVKRVPGGVVSTYLHDQASPGMALQVLGPSGTFRWTPKLPGDLVLVAAGSGITPIFSIAQAAVAAGRRVALLYGNRTEADVIFRRELDDLQASHPGRFFVRHVLSRPAQGWTGDRGRIDAPLLDAWLSAVPWAGAPETRFYLCGPEGLMSAAQRVIAGRQVDSGRILRERYVSPHEGTPNPAAWQVQSMTVRSNGTMRTVRVQPGQTLLEAGLQAGLPFKFSCMMGGCAACKVKLRSGAVHMGEPNALTSAERDDGHALACIARPLEPVEVELE